jgi:hypothetical protein
MRIVDRAEWGGCPMAATGRLPTFGSALRDRQDPATTPRPFSAEGRQDMSRYERGIYFERLCALRAAYAAQGAEDRAVSISIEAVIEFAERELATADCCDVPEARRSTASADHRN